MLNLNGSKAKISALMTILISVGTIAPMVSPIPVMAKPIRTVQQPVSNQVIIPVGTQIPVRYEQAQKILVTPTETLPVTLKVATNITDRFGTVLIPAGSDVVGQIEPDENGARFVAQKIVINQQSIWFDATSAVVTTTETISQGASTQDILTGTLAGAGAATLIAGVTGDRKIDPLEILAGAAVGTLAGWGLPTTGVLGGSRKELISIDPNQDLTLTVQSQLIFDRVKRESFKPRNAWVFNDAH